MRNTSFWWILIGFMGLLDIYFFQALKVITHSSTARTRIIIHTTYWVLSVFAIVMLIILPYIHFEKQAKLARSTIFAMIAGLFFAKLIASLFFMIDDIRRVIQWVAGKLFFSKTDGEDLQAGETITRSVFLSWAGMIVGGGLFGTLIYGFRNKYRYQVKKYKLSYANLPASFKG